MWCLVDISYGSYSSWFAFRELIDPTLNVVFVFPIKNIYIRYYELFVRSVQRQIKHEYASFQVSLR